MLINMFYLRNLSIYGTRLTLYSFKMNLSDTRRCALFRSCLDFREFAALKSHYNQSLGEFSFLQLFTSRLCHSSAKVTRTAQVNSKSEKSKFQEIQVVADDGLGLTTTKMKRSQAEQIARDKNLKLVLVDNATGSPSAPLYRLMTSAEYRTRMKEIKEVQRLEKLPEMKMLKLNSTIAERDLQMKISHVSEWIQNGHSVKVTIVSSRKSLEFDNDAVFNKIISASKEIATVKQATKTAAQMLFHLVPRTTPSKKDTTRQPTESGCDKDQRPLKTDELKRLREEQKSVE